jgi:hypothetical protein
MKKPIIIVIVLAAIACFYYLYSAYAPAQNDTQNQNNRTPEASGRETASKDDNGGKSDNAKPETDESLKEEPAEKPETKTETVIGKSAGGRDITAYHYGTGTREVLFVGGIHGAYAWNTSLLAYLAMDYLKNNPAAIPADIRVTVIPALNPDGLSKVVGITGPFKISDVSSTKDLRIAGRFNGNSVDLNRNFDCNWQASGVWQDRTVSGGSAAFSEPESAAVRDYAKNRTVAAVVAWYSSGGGVFSSSCGNGILPETQVITDIYAKAASYPAYKNFESYQVSGDMTDWFAKNNVPAIGVLLSSSDDAEWDKNLAGIKALLEHYAK